MKAQEQLGKRNLTGVFSKGSIWLLILKFSHQAEHEGKVTVEDKRTCRAETAQKHQKKISLVAKSVRAQCGTAAPQGTGRWSQV